MRIDIICNDGSPLGVTEKSIFGEDGRVGVGGAELALLTMCRGWHDAGHKVTLYNTADTSGSVFKHEEIDRFSPQSPRDVLIVFRSPNSRIKDGAQGLKVWWSCDQRTVGEFNKFAGLVDKIVTISPYHSQYFSDMYGIHNTIPIDLPVRVSEYDLKTPKVPARCIWNSMPDRGVKMLAPVWARIQDAVPEASLTITSDWRLWSQHAPAELLNQYRMEFAPLPNVTYSGAVNRKELIQLELEAQLNLATNIYEELFCIAIAECQVAGAYPVSSNSGAIRTTNMGQIFPGNPADVSWQKTYAEFVIELLRDPKRLNKLIKENQKKAIERFSLAKILEQWNEVFNG